METNRKSNISVTFSLIALSMAFVTTYVEFFKPITLDFAISRDAYIANTVGGIPDVNLSIALRANGPTTKAIIVNSANVTITNLQTDESHILTSPSQEGEFPLILKGGDIITRSILFQVNDYIPEQIDRYDAWCNKLIKLFQDEADLIRNICNKLKEDFLPVRGNNQVLIQPDYFSESEHQTVDDLLREKYILDAQISKLLGRKSVEVEQLQRLLFFMSGNYEMQIEILDPFGTSLAVQKRKFSIDEIVSNSLRYKFNTNLRIHISQVDSA